MKILGNGRIFLEKGEQFPLVCPKCTGYVEFTCPRAFCFDCTVVGLILSDPMRIHKCLKISGLRRAHDTQQPFFDGFSIVFQ